MTIGDITNPIGQTFVADDSGKLLTLTLASGKRTSLPGPRPITTRWVPSNVKRVSSPAPWRTMIVMGMRATVAPRARLSPPKRGARPRR